MLQYHTMRLRIFTCSLKAPLFNLFVLGALLCVVLFHDVSHAKDDVFTEHRCIFCQSDIDKTPSQAKVHVLVYFTFIFSCALYQTPIKSAFSYLRPLLRAPPLYS